MVKVAVDCYERKFGEDLQAVFVHTVREIGSLGHGLGARSA